jgi:hypothetical protein
MSHLKYQDVLLRLLSMWEQHLAKLDGRRPRTLRPALACATTGLNEFDTAPTTKSQYLSQRIARAVEPLAILLHESDVRFIKMMLEERIRTDPQLARIVERATRRFT